MQIFPENQLHKTLRSVALATGATAVLLSAGLLAIAQAPAASAPANRFLGTITAISTGLVTVKTDAGVEHKVTVPEGIKLQQIAPGEKDLSKATSIQFADLSVGDRILVRIAPEPTAEPVTAISIVDIPKADLAQKQQKEREDWQRRGVGGLVKSVDPGTGVIVIVSGAGAILKTTTLHTTPATILRRYAPDSVDFAQAKPAPIEALKVGDQLRARGVKSPDGTEMAAEEVVSGSFRNIAGTISSVDQKAMTLTLKDLATKQNVTVHVGADAQMRKLPDNVAKMLASITKPGDAPGGTPGGAPGSAPGSAPASSARPGNPGAGYGAPAGSNPAGAAASAPGGQPHSWAGPGGPGPGGPGAGGPGAGGQGAGWQGGRGAGGDPQQMISRAPAIHLSDLQKGDAVMLVSTQGASDVTAITLLAGVEPLLQAPASTQSALLSNWNMSSGGAEAAAQ
jgi:hypothetical protein